MKFSKLIPAIVLGLMPATAMAQNLMTNSSFEVDGPGFILFQGWENYGEVYKADSGEIIALDGSFTAKMFGPSIGSQADQVLLQQVSGITPGELYTLSGSVQHQAVAPLGNENIILIQMVFRDAGGNALEAVEQTALTPGVSPTDEWIESSVSGIAPAGTASMTVALLHIQLGSDAGFPVQGGGATFWDDFSLVSGSAPCTNPADFTGDGQLDVFDVFAFVDAYNQGCPE